MAEVNARLRSLDPVAPSAWDPDVWVSVDVQPPGARGIATASCSNGAGAAVQQEQFDDLIASRDALRADNLAKDEIIGLVAHELRNPLTAIMAAARRLSVAGRVAQEEAETVKFLVEDTVRLQTLIANMLVIAMGDRTAELEPLLIQHWLPAAVATHQSRSPRCEIVVEVQKSLPVVLGHTGWLDQVMDNLLGNAEKYCPAGSLVMVTAEATPDGVAVRVLDSGPGFAPDHARKLFEAFHREEATIGSPGVGLGLAVCKRLVELQGGSIWAHARPEGGAEFGFQLNLAE